MVNSPRCRWAAGEHQSWAWSAWDGTSWGQGTPGLASGGDQKQRHEGRRAAYVQDAVYLGPPGRELGLQCAKCHWWRS